MKKIWIVLIIVSSALLGACQSVPDPPVTYDTASLRFLGEQAFEIETGYVSQFPDRQSGQPNNRRAVEWFVQHLSALGWECKVDEWTVTSYSKPLQLNNGVCRLAGKSDREILVVAHQDIAVTTQQGADNDASGVAILAHLAEIFAGEGQPAHTLVFVSTDGEEIGMAGTGRYLWTHPDAEKIIAGFSLDNLGRTYYDGMKIEMIGQYHGYTPAWLPLTVRQAARAGGLWDVRLLGTLDQVTNQAVPVSLMDQGPMVAAGVPALGFAGHEPAEFADLHYRTLWHGAEDTLDYQSAAALGQSGLLVEAAIRQLLSMQSYPQASGPYLYFDNSRQMLSGLPLWLAFILFTGLFFLGSALTGSRSWVEKVKGWRHALPHFLGLWLPLLATILLMYLLVALGLMVKYYAWPGIYRDPLPLQVSWLAVFIILLGLAAFLFIGRWLTRRLITGSEIPEFGAIKSLSFLVIGLAGVYLLFRNPFSLLFLLPVLFWMLIGGRQGFGKALDILFFILGGLLVYFLIYQFGFITLNYDWKFLWYFLNMFSSQMVSFTSEIVITAVVGAGLAMLINPPAKKQAF